MSDRDAFRAEQGKAHSPVCPVICCGPTGDDAHDALAIMAEPWMHQCGSCDAGLPMMCTCPPGDPRIVISHLWTAYEAAREATDAE